MNNQFSFKNVAMNPDNPKYQQAISRMTPLYAREVDIRNEFSRDYTRILWTKGYRRLKHKTQVFFAVSNDHVCSRLEHVMLVQSVSESIAQYLGLNVDLARAISLGHDLGHAPFGHGGEKIINQLSVKLGLPTFFHEKNGLHFVDDIETLTDNLGHEQNLNLCYALRDGIVCHCGEIHQTAIKPREEAIDLALYERPGQYEPYTYEGCVVKMADKIAYLSRDIEDALELNILSADDVNRLCQQLHQIDDRIQTINNGNLTTYFISDICLNSTPETGIALSKQGYDVMQALLAFNYEKIYLNPRLKIFDSYVKTMLEGLFNTLNNIDWNRDLYRQLEEKRQYAPTLITYFIHWLEQYGNLNRSLIYSNKVIYELEKKSDYERAVLDYLAGMTDTFIIKVYNELVSF